MRPFLGMLCLVALSSSAFAATVDFTTYAGWGGEGKQVYRNLVSLARNNPYAERMMIVLVDDIPRRGPRLGVQRVEVEYKGGDGYSDKLMDQIHKKPYPYVLIPVYDVPQSPRMARVVLPQAAHVKATFRFYKNRHRLASGEIDSGLIPELTRTLDTTLLTALPAINPMRDPSIRKPRRGEEDEAHPTPAAVAVETDDHPATPGTADEPPPLTTDLLTGAAAPSDSDPRVVAARSWAAKTKDELSGEPPPPTQPPDSAPGAVGLPDAPSDAQAGGTATYKGLQLMDDTDEMKAAERRAAAMADRVRVQQAFQQP